jgi:hypothetical protein
MCLCVFMHVMNIQAWNCQYLCQSALIFYSDDAVALRFYLICNHTTARSNALSWLLYCCVTTWCDQGLLINTRYKLVQVL